MQCYMRANGIVRITDTLKYIPKAFVLTYKTTEDNLQQAIGEIIEIMQDLLKTLSLFFYRDATKNPTNQIAQISQRSKAQPHLQNLPLPPMLPQSQNQNILPLKITNTPSPAPKAEPVVQPTRLQKLTTTLTSPMSEKPPTSPISDPYSNPWIIFF